MCYCSNTGVEWIPNQSDTVIVLEHSRNQYDTVIMLEHGRNQSDTVVVLEHGRSLRVFVSFVCV